jgi:hypothetical protein
MSTKSVMIYSMRKCIHCSREIDEQEEYIHVGCHKYTEWWHVIYYHMKCFEEIAGKEYIEEIIKKHDES